MVIASHRQSAQCKQPLSNSWQWLLLWNLLCVITIPHPYQAWCHILDTSDFSWLSLLSFWLHFRRLCLWKAVREHGEGPQRLCHGDGDGHRCTFVQSALQCVHKPPQLLPQKLWYWTQVRPQTFFLRGNTFVNLLCHSFPFLVAPAVNRIQKWKHSSCSRGNDHMLCGVQLRSEDTQQHWFNWCNVLKGQKRNV